MSLWELLPNEGHGWMEHVVCIRGTREQKQILWTGEQIVREKNVLNFLSHVFVFYNENAGLGTRVIIWANASLRRQQMTRDTMSRIFKIIIRCWGTWNGWKLTYRKGGCVWVRFRVNTIFLTWKFKMGREKKQWRAEKGWKKNAVRRHAVGKT